MGLNKRRVGWVVLALVAVAVLWCAGASRGMRELRAMAEGAVLYATTSDADGTTRLCLWGPEEPTVLDGPIQGRIVDASWSPDGQRVAVSPREGPLRVVGVDGALQSELDVQAWSPTWSPDGARLAYIVGDEVWVSAPDGSGARALGHRAHQVRWSPTDDRLALAQSGAVRIVDADGLELSGAVHPGRLDDIEWSPDGRRLALGGGAISILEPGDPPRRLQTPAGFAASPAWSPDGTRLVYTVLEPGNSDWPYLVVEWVDGSGARTELMARGYDPQWSPDAEALVYYAVGHLEVTRPGGSGRATLTRGPSTEGLASWRPQPLAQRKPR